jgi:hypothetical protein
MDIICKYCNKKYASQSSRSNHIKKYHNLDGNPESNHSNHEKLKNCEKSNPESNHINDENECKFKCRNCNKDFKFKQNRWRHEKTCNEKENKIDLVLKENIEMKKENSEMKKEMEALKIMLQKALKIHPKTLNKMNNNGCIVNNGTMNVQIVQLGHENLQEVLSTKQKLSILNRQAMSINDLVELIHTTPEFKQFQNVCITNLQSSFGFMYNDKAKKFIAVNKNELLDDLIDNRMYDIGNFYKEIENKLTPEKATRVKKFIDRMLKEPELKNLKKEEIKLILYNNKDKINIEDGNQLEI